MYGCKEEAVVKLVYSKQFEADRRQCRCTTCANYVREQDDTEIKKQELIVDANDLPQEYYDHIELENEERDCPEGRGSGE